MISNINNASANTAYSSNGKTAQVKENMNTTDTSKESSSKVDKLKESVDSGQYKVDLSALANKMADELL